MLTIGFIIDFGRIILYEWYILSKFDQLNFILTACHIDKYYIFGFISISLPHNRQLYRLTTDRLVDIPSNNACTKEITLINMIIPCVIFNARTQFHFDRCTFSDKSPLHIIPWNKMNFIFKTLNISSLQILVLIYGISKQFRNEKYSIPNQFNNEFY